MRQTYALFLKPLKIPPSVQPFRNINYFFNLKSLMFVNRVVKYVAEIPLIKQKNLLINVFSFFFKWFFC